MFPISKAQFNRLHKLCDFMESLPKTADKHFHMSSYIEHHGRSHTHDLGKKPTAKDLHTCGTTACALGWAVTVPSFRRAGLWIEKDGGYEIRGAEKVFGTTPFYYHWEEIFGPYNTDKSPRSWAKRVRRLLKKFQAEAKEKAA